LLLRRHHDRAIEAVKKELAADERNDTDQNNAILDAFSSDPRYPRSSAAKSGFVSRFEFLTVRS
jgi:hypothetical protein